MTSSLICSVILTVQVLYTLVFLLAAIEFEGQYPYELWICLISVDFFPPFFFFFSGSISGHKYSLPSLPTLHPTSPHTPQKDAIQQSNFCYTSISISQLQKHIIIFHLKKTACQKKTKCFYSEMTVASSLFPFRKFKLWAIASTCFSHVDIHIIFVLGQLGD